jgi:hypothetical protein
VDALFQEGALSPNPQKNHPPKTVCFSLKAAVFTEQCQQEFMAAIFAFYEGKAVVQIAAIEITIDHLLDIWPPEAVQII